MQYFELTCSTFLKKDLPYQQSFEELSSYINFCLHQDSYTKNIHEQKRVFKPYCFGGLIPGKDEKIYQQGSTYKFSIRTIDETLAKLLVKLLRENINHSTLQVLEVHKKTIKQFFISELYSVTPIVVSLPQVNKQKPKFWSLQDDLSILMSQLQNNLLRKYKHFYKEELKPKQNFIQFLEIKNKKPQSIHISKKNFKYYGSKFKIVPNEDEISQKLAFMALCVGAGEKSSYAAGFVLGKGMRC